MGHIFVALTSNNLQFFIKVQKSGTHFLDNLLIHLVTSRDRHFSPSLPGNRYLNLASKSDLRDEISRSIVWYDALAPRPDALFSFSDFYANNVFWVLSFAHGQISQTCRFPQQVSKPLFTMLPYYEHNNHFCHLSKQCNFCNIKSVF